MLTSIIIAYRNVISERYEYDQIIEQYEIPDSFTRDKFDTLRSYFLNYIYPPPEERARLNAAFGSLEQHIANPKYLLNVLMDAFGIIFKYGRHLPKILRTGLQAMQSFKKANQFEEQLASAAAASSMTPPFSSEDIEQLTARLSKSDVESFIEDSLKLFDVLHDRKLVARIIDIVQQLITKMEAKPEVYPSSEIDGLRLGRDLIVEGNRLFESLTRAEQDRLFDMVVEIERGVLEDLFG